MQTLFKSNLFSKSSSKVGAKNFLSGGKKLGSSIVGAARNNIIGFNRTAKAMVPQKKEENENSFIKNYTNFFGSKKTEKILRKNLKLVRDSLVNTFEIARHLKAVIVDISAGTTTLIRDTFLAGLRPVEAVCACIPDPACALYPIKE